MSKIAIYARKSVFREDSISIESQIEQCEYEARGEEYLVYKDNGFSGKDTDRPDFQRMMTDIRAGLINKVIVYRLDRVSRSVLDFSEMMEEFQKYNVAFVSATEHFDTSSPMGRAMLNICIVFAQLERETIQQRVTDAYASRSKRGFYMGGKIPYGYKKVPHTIDGVKTSMYMEEPEEANDIRLIYQLYSKPSATLGDVLRELKTRGININRRGHCWNTSRLSEIMRNPAYTSNDLLVYNFFAEQKSNIIDSRDVFDGERSLYLFKGENTNRKTWDLSGQNIVTAPHKGIVDSKTWVYCRQKLLGNHQIKNCKAKNSFLSGKIKCGNCGYAIVVKFSQRCKGHVRYFIDTGWTEHRVCEHKLPTIHSDDFEQMIIGKINEKIETLTLKQKQGGRDELAEEIEQLKYQIKEIESSIDTLISGIITSSANNATMKYINQKIKDLDSQKQQTQEIIDKKIAEKNKQKADVKQLTHVMSKWDLLSFDDKRSVVELLIEKILVYPDKVEIMWRI